MKSKVIIWFLSQLLFVSVVNAQDVDFKKYSANLKTINHAKKLQINGANKKYKTLLTGLSKQPINFAGHYVLDSFGCGGGCQALAVYNAKTGHAFIHPQTFSDCYSQTYGFVSRDYDFHTNSRLLVVTGSRSAQPYQCEKVYYLVDENGFAEISQSWIYKKD